MEIILQKDYPLLGFTGEKVTVKNGFARNFLIPRGIGLEVNRTNAKYIKNRLIAIEATKAKLRAQAEGLGQKIASENLEFVLKIGKKGKSFGSISSREIHEDLVKRGYQLERRQIILPEPIKFVGTFAFQVRLHSDYTAEVPLKIIADKNSVKDEGEDFPVVEETAAVGAEVTTEKAPETEKKVRKPRKSAKEASAQEAK